MKIKFLADENLRRAIVSGVRRREAMISFALATDVGADAKDDSSVLQISAQQGRVLVSHDIRTMSRHFRQFTTAQSSPGLLLIPQRLPLAFAIEELILIWAASQAEEWENQIAYLPL